MPSVSNWLERSDLVLPRIAYLPSQDHLTETADECLEFIESVGYYLDPWQGFLTWSSLLESSNDRWLCRGYGYLAPRQNGKGGILTARSITDLFFLPCFDHDGSPKPRLVVYTAHQFKTANEAFLRMQEVIEGSPDLRAMMKQDRNHGIRNSAIDKGFDLANGNRLRYLARSTGGSGRGLSIDTLLTDEGQELPTPAWDALKYTQRAMPNPQRIITGTVPTEANNHDVWTAVRDIGRTGTSKTQGWAEYSPDPDDPQTAHDMTRDAQFGYDVDPDLKYALRTNPAFGIRVTAETLQDDLEGSADSYKREVLCWWPGASGGDLLLKNWQFLGDPRSEPVDPVVFALEVAVDRSYSSIAVGGVRLNGRVHLELVDYAPGTDWVTDRLAELNTKWYPSALLMDVGGPAGWLVDDLEEAKVPIRPLTVREFGAACGWLHDQVRDRSVNWLHHPALQSAVKALKWRALGTSGAKAFDRNVGVDIAPAIGVAMAGWAASQGALPPVEKVKREKVASSIMYGFR